jgi:CHAT domain-containing protein
MSSYTPTIRALIHARRVHPDDSDGDPSMSHLKDRIVIVAMPHTPGAADLPGAEAEADLLRKRFSKRVLTLTGPDATHDAVLAALPTARWAHFACHGSSDLANPSASYLMLTDHQHQPLTVVDVARLRLAQADLAFLSACSTARPGSRLADEAIHLTSAFHLAGYRHVIGTLWPINDRLAVEVADDVYAAIPGNIAADEVASALHSVTRRLRNRWRHKPSVWASHIHSGA